MRTVFLSLILLAAPSFAEMPAGDADRGRLLFGKCRTCHYPEQQVGHHNGPSLYNIFGKIAGKQEGFEYSPLFAALDFAWTPELLDVWLANPDSFLVGSQMVFAPFANAQERADVIEYLKQFRPAE